MKKPLLDCVNLGKTFTGNTEPLFQQINMSIHQGEWLSLIGPSGCGKTTLLRCIAGLELQSTGTIELDGHSISDVRPENRPIVMMFQQPLLFPHLSIMENIVYGLKSKGLSKKQQQAEGSAYLEKIHMSTYAPAYPYELSGGQKQRVALARALILKPRLILLDEPFSSLDPGLRISIRSWVKQVLQEEGVTALFVTHDKEEAMMLGNRLAVIKEGTVQQIGPPIEVYEKPRNRIVAEFFSDGMVIGGHSFVPAQYIELLPEQETLEQEKDLMSHKPFLVQGEIRAHWMKYGQNLYQILLKDSLQVLVLPSSHHFQIGDKAYLQARQSDAHTF